MHFETMCAVIEQYVYQHRRVRIRCKPDITSQRELFLLEYVYTFISKQQGFHVEFH